MNLDGSTGSARAVWGDVAVKSSVRWGFLLIVGFALWAARPAVGATLATNTVSITNSTLIALTNTAGNVPANPYPSVISFSNVIGQVSNVTVSLRNLTHAWTRDIDILLVAPDGRKVLLMSDAGNGGATAVTLTLDDSAPTALPLLQMTTGTFRPADYAPTEIFPAPAPASPYSNTLAALKGQSANGVWTLYVMDDGANDIGNIVGGWSLTLTVVTDGTERPAISTVADQTIPEDGTTGPLSFTVADSDTPLASLVLAGGSSNPVLVPTNNIVFSGSGSNRTVTVTPAPNVHGTATITLFVTDGNTATNSIFLLTVNPVNDTPTLTGVADQVINEDGTTGPLNFTIGDVETAAASLALSPGSSNPALVPTGNIVFGGSGSNRTVTVTPVPNAFGSALITLTVSDGTNSAGTNFLVTVNPVNDAPTITGVADQNINEDGATGLLNFTIGDLETPAASLAVSAGSSNPTLVPTNNIVFGGAGSSRTVTVTPAANTHGTAIIFLSVSDGAIVTTTNFLLIVNPVNDAPTITGVPDQSINEDASTAVLPFVVGDLETPAAGLIVSGGSSNPTLVPTNNVVFGGSGANRTVTVTPATNAFGTAIITLFVSDGTNLVSTNFLLTVNPVNDAPTLTGVGDQSINEDTATAALGFQVEDLETPAGSLTLSSASSNPALVPTNSIGFGGSGGNRTVTLTPLTNAHGTATITLTVSDGANSTSTDFVLTVNPVNDAPTIATVVDQVVNEDAATALLGFTVGDIETAAGSLVMSGGSSNPALVPTNNIVLGGSGASRTVVVTPAANAHGSAAIFLTVSDGTNSTTTNFVLTVTPVNDAPTMTGIANQSINEDTPTAPLGFQIGDVETPADQLILSRGSSNPALVPTNNIFFGGSASNRTVTVTPALNQHGTAVITLTVSDGTNSAITNFVLTVNPVNDAPSITGVPDQSIIESQTAGPLSFTVGDVETAAGGLTLSSVSSDPLLIPTNSIVFGGSGSNRTVTLTPIPEAYGIATITLRASDGTNTTSTNFLLIVNPYNDPPTITGVANQIINEDGATGLLGFLVGDIETPVNLLTLSGGSSNPALVPTNNIVFGGSGSSRTVTVTPVANGYGVATVFLTVSDGTNFVSTNFLLTVTPVNDAPGIAGVPVFLSIAEDTSTGPLSFNVGDLETSAALLTLGAETTDPALVPTNNIVFGGSGSNRTMTVTPAPNAYGTVILTMLVSDGTNSSNAELIIDFTPVNDAPGLSSVAGQTIDEDTTTGLLGFIVGDVETAAASLTVAGASSNPALVPTNNIVLGGSGSNRTVTVTPLLNTHGTATISLILNDGTNSTTTNFVLTVNPVNDGPALTGVAAQVINEDGATAALGLTVGDVETSALSLAMIGGSSNPALVPTNNIVFGGSGSDRTVTVTPAPDANGSATIFLTVGDGTNSTTTNFLLTVNPVNDAPTLTGVAEQTIAEDGATAALSFTVGDVETSALSLAMIGGSSNPALVPTNNIVLGGSGSSRTVVVTPAPDANGTAIIFLTVGDGTNTTTTSFSLIVNPVNDAPALAGVPAQSIDEDGTTGPLNVTVSDVETLAGNLTLSSVSSNPALVPTNNIVFGGGAGSRTVTLTPLANAYGTATITLTVKDGTNSTSTNFVLSVNPVNDAPTISVIEDQFINEDTGAGPLSFSIGDLESSAANLILVRGSDNPALVPTNNIVVSGSGSNRTVTVTPAPNGEGVAIIALTVSDGTNAVSVQFFLIVDPVNDAPTLTGVTDQAVAEDTATAPLVFVIGDIETSATGLVLNRGSSNPALVPTNNIVFGGSGSNRTVTVTPALNAHGTAILTLTVGDGALSVSTNFILTVDPVNDVPVIVGAGDQATSENTTVGPLSFTVGDVETEAGELLVFAVSSNPELVAPEGIVLGGFDALRTLTVTPLSNQLGTASIELMVFDGTNSFSTNFVLMVFPTNFAPTITGVADQIINEDMDTGALSFSVGDVETAVGSLSLSGECSDTNLVPAGNILFGGSGANRTVTVIPAPNANGFATITLTVNDGTKTASTNFLLLVDPVDDLPTVSAMSDQMITEELIFCGCISATAHFTVQDPDGAETLTVSASSSNPALVPQANFYHGGIGIERLVRVTPLTNTSGSAIITVTVSDGLHDVSTNFLFTMTAANFPPSLSAIGDQAINQGASTGPLNFTVSDPETPAASLIVSGVSSNPTLVPSNNIVFGGSGANRTVTVTPAAGQSGIGAITIQVSDGVRVTSTVFDLGVSSPLLQTRLMTNTTVLTVADAGVASLYPSVINVSGILGVIENVEITLRNMTHPQVADLDVLLVSPGGPTVVVCSDAGSGGVSGVTLTLSDFAANSLPQAALASGFYRPTDYSQGDPFPAPAPVGPRGTTMSTFKGYSPNGVWALYVRDDASGQQGGINGGWSLKITSVFSSFNLQGFTTNGGAVLLLQGSPSQAFLIEASEDLLTWEVLDEIQPANGSFTFVDATAWSHGSRFYRARPTP